MVETKWSPVVSGEQNRPQRNMTAWHTVTFCVSQRTHMQMSSSTAELSLSPVAVFLKMASNVLAGETLRTATHTLQNLAGNCFLDAQSLDSSDKSVMQLARPLNLHDCIPGSSLDSACLCC